MHGLHLIFTTYGFWLPNDPRGSGSTRVRTWHLYDAGGEATKVATSRSVAHVKHDCQARLRVKQELKYPPVRLTGLQARAVGRGFAMICPNVELVIYACAIMPDHVHVVVAQHAYTADDLIACLKRAGTRGMNAEGMHPLAAHPRSNGKRPSPWSGGGRKVFLNSRHHMLNAIRYVEQNPVRASFKRQRWSFVVPFA